MNPLLSHDGGAQTHGSLTGGWGGGGGGGEDTCSVHDIHVRCRMHHGQNVPKAHTNIYMYVHVQRLGSILMRHIHVHCINCNMHVR